MTDTPYAELAQCRHQLDLVTTDRDIKAANLHLLVEKVLSAELLQLSTGRDISPDEQREEDRKLEALVDLARSLKQ